LHNCNLNIKHMIQLGDIALMRAEWQVSAPQQMAV
jgi:hypothetical protein